MDSPLQVPDLVRAIQAHLAQKYGLTVDGNAGIKTFTAIATELDCVPPPPDLSQTPWAVIPQNAFNLILDSEGIDQPWRWPGLDSGISLGPGFDLSAETRAELHEAWDRYLTPIQISRLESALGKSGQSAAALAPAYRDITITRAQSDDVFYRIIVPKYWRQMVGTFPFSDSLPGAAQGALLSLVYNRGTALNGDRRREMLAIHNITAKADLPLPAKLRAIASQIRSMERLWPDNPQSNDDLHDRREKEARLVESCIG